MCTGCPEGATRDGIICRPMGLCSGQDGDRDGVPDDCDNCTFTFNPDQDSSLCAPVEGVCPGGVASDLTWSPTSVGSTDQKPCLLPSTGKCIVLYRTTRALIYLSFSCMFPRLRYSFL